MKPEARIGVRFPSVRAETTILMNLGTSKLLTSPPDLIRQTAGSRRSWRAILIGARYSSAQPGLGRETRKTAVLRRCHFALPQCCRRRRPRPPLSGMTRRFRRRPPPAARHKCVGAFTVGFCGIRQGEEVRYALRLSCSCQNFLR